MPVDTRVDGDPAAVRDTARLLRERLAFEVAGGAQALSLSRVDAATGWEGVAGSAFHDRMASAGLMADALRGDIAGTAVAFDEMAAHLDDVKQRMRTAQEIAAVAGLVVSGEQILEPGPAPGVPELPGNNAATPDMVAARNAAIQATAVNARQWEAYRAAAEEAGLARVREEAALEAIRRHHASVVSAPLIRSGDVTASAHTQTRTGLGLSASAGALTGVAGLGTAASAGAVGLAGGLAGGSDDVIEPNAPKPSSEPPVTAPPNADKPAAETAPTPPPNADKPAAEPAPAPPHTDKPAAEPAAERARITEKSAA